MFMKSCQDRFVRILLIADGQFVNGFMRLYSLFANKSVGKGVVLLSCLGYI